MSGDTFTVQGGFWGIAAAVQTAGAPHLEVTTGPRTVIVWWAQPAEGWRLEYAPSLAAGSQWTEIPPPYEVSGTNTISYTQTAPVGNRFYRLKR